MECGLTGGEQLLGGGGGEDTIQQREGSCSFPPRWVHSAEAKSIFFPRSVSPSPETLHAPPPLGASEGGKKEERRRSLPPRLLETVRESILDVLSVFHLEGGEETRDKAEQWFLYLAQRREKSGKKLRGKEVRVMLAFSIVRTLNQLGMPRPTASVAELCGLDSCSEILRLGDSLQRGFAGDSTSSSATRKTRDASAEREKEVAGEEKGPEAHVSTLCALLGIPFVLSHTTRQLIDVAELRWRLYGSRPHHIAAGALLSVVAAAAKGGRWAEGLGERETATALSCSVQCLRRVRRSIAPFELDFSHRPPSVRLLAYNGGEEEEEGRAQSSSARRQQESNQIFGREK